MANIKTFADVLPGAIVTSKQGNRYVLLCDEEGNRGLFSQRGTWIRVNNDGLTFGKNHAGVAKIEDFDTLPILDRISEGLKYIFTDRGNCAPLITVYTAEDPRRIAALEAAERAEAEARRQRAIAARYAQ